MLNIIIGYGEIILSQLQVGDPLRSKVSEIVKAGQHSAALTRQLLAFSRRQALLPEVLDLNALIRNLETMLYRLIGENINLVVSLSKDSINVVADPTQIEQVLLDLTVNARNAMPDGGKLTFETSIVELDKQDSQLSLELLPGPYAHLVVTATGVA